MFRIRRIYDTTLSIDKKIVIDVQNILRAQFSLLSEKEILDIPNLLNNPLKYQMRSILFVADDIKGNVNGFAFVFYDPILNFIYLDFLSAAKFRTGKGIGNALYQRVREEAILLKAIGIFFECLPDDPRLCRDKETLRQNRARLRFYEKFGAKPIMNTKYETPVKPRDDNPPYLVYDNLGSNKPLAKSKAQIIARTILERKYKKLCPKAYIDMVVNSFLDDPIRLRPNKYFKNVSPAIPSKTISLYNSIIMVVSKKHQIHHIKEKGYIESPVRISSILGVLEKTNIFHQVVPKQYPLKEIAMVHDIKFLGYLKRMCKLIEPGQSLYPYVFPIRNPNLAPRQMPIRAGYYCIDTFTPLTHNVFAAAKHATDCALTAANMLLFGHRIAYALVRPPGHHAERKSFGGFCYINSTAVAANYLSTYGKVAILDIDYHHGNGQQDIFWDRSDVLTISIHGNPKVTFPYFSGYKEETGGDGAKGYNINIPLRENISSEAYHLVLQKTLNKIIKFRPQFLVIALGLDIAKDDPTGTWNFVKEDFAKNGAMIGELRKPTLVVQEGGYNTHSLGKNAEAFFIGLWSSMHHI